MEPPQINVNGQIRHLDPERPHTNLLDWLRAQGLRGAKEGCAEGECGACAVLVARPEGADGEALPAGAGGTGAALTTAASTSTAPAPGAPTAPAPARTRWVAINACLPPALAYDGQEIVTAEGLGTAPGPGTDGDLHPVQREMAQRGGSQCGYCTPGFVCAMAAEYYRPDRWDVPGPSADRHDRTDHGDHTIGPNGFDLHALSGNLCRCTGYRPIRDAAYALSTPHPDDPLALRRDLPAPCPRPTVQPPEQPAVGTPSDGAEPDQPGTAQPERRARGEHARFVRPATFTDLLEYYAQHPDAALLAGATDLGVTINIAHARPPMVLAIDHMPELRTWQITEHHIEIGAGLTLSELERTVAKQVPMLGELLPQFASPLIRNTATLGGNIATASPIGDGAPVLLALDATVLLASRGAEREVPLADYFTGYRTTIAQPGEVIRAFRIPTPLAPLSTFHKVAKRRFDDISSIAVAIAMQLHGNPDDDAQPGPRTVTRARIGLGGVAATPIRATATEEALTGRPWTAQTARTAAAIMATEGTPMDDHRASARYRAAMLEQSLLRFFTQTHLGDQQ